MAVMLRGPCPKCGKEVNYGGNTWEVLPPLCKRCQRIDDIKNEETK